MAPATDQNEKKRLSYASAQYDVEQKGHLTKDQQMLRDLDLDGDGKLDVNELQPFVERHNELLKENAKVKRNQIILLYHPLWDRYRRCLLARSQSQSADYRRRRWPASLQGHWAAYSDAEQGRHGHCKAGD